MVCYAYEKKETYFQHIYCMLNVWNQIRRYYTRGLTRILGFDADKVVKLAILSHDFGKLTKIYQEEESERRFYRHEVISAYLAYTIFPEFINNKDVVDMLANAVFLHHENIILSVYAGEAGERLIPLSTIRKMLERYANYKNKGNMLSISCTLNDDSYYNAVKSEISNLDEITNKVMEKMRSPEVNEIYSTISEIVVNATSKIGEASLVFRNKVAALLHILNVCDSVAANINRGDEKDEGNWIAERAFQGAELLKKDNIKCECKR